MKKSNKRHERGATAIEYGLIIALMVLAIIPAFQTLNGSGNGMYAGIVDKVVAATAHVR
jgi:pilus assembly protein Flp/PilA